MAGKIWSMTDGDSVAVEHTGDTTGRDAAYARLTANGGHTLWTPGTEGVAVGSRPANVTLDRVGAGLRSFIGDAAFAGKAGHNVRNVAYGAIGDGVANDTTAVQAAITAAEADGSYLVIFPAGTYKINSGGLVCKRETWLVGSGFATLEMTSTTATLVKWASSTVGTRLLGGGARGLRFKGAGGSSTSIGVSFGDASNPSYYAHRLSLIECEVTAFGTGVRIDGPGALSGGIGSATDGFVIRRCNIQTNVYNGLFCVVNFPIEINTISECHFSNNGTAQATGAAIQLSASGGGGGTLASAALNLSIYASTFNVNGDGTLGQIHCPASAWMDLKMDGCSFESITLGRTHIAALSDGSGTYNGPRSRVILSNCYLQHFDLTSFKEAILFGAGELQIVNTKIRSEAPADFTVASCTTTNGSPTITTTNNFLTAGVRPGMPVTGTGLPANAIVSTVNSATSITLNANCTASGTVTLSFDALFALIRAGKSGQYTGVSVIGCYLAMGGSNAANRRVLNLSLGAQGNTFFSTFGNTLDGFGSAASLLMNREAAMGDGDLWTTVGDYVTGNGITCREFQLQSATDPSLVVPLDLTKVTDYGNKAYLFAANSVAGFLTPVIGTGSLPAAAAAENGKVFIEDNGAGDRNIVFYAGSQRFRIDGGAAF